MVLGAPALAEGSLDEGRGDVMRTLASIIAASALSSCVSISVDEHNADAALAAIENARVRSCSPERTQANARSGSDAQSSGTAASDIALVPLASDATRAIRLRRIVVQPGGVIAWHAHGAMQGAALVVSGEMTEFRNTCLDPLLYRAGDVAIEDAGTAHGWRNESDGVAVVLVSHVVVR